MWPWAALALLGAYHGINPGMGWLFAVSRGLQEKSRRAVLVAIGPILLGHEASILMIVATVMVTQEFLAPHTVRLLAALVLVTFGAYKLARPLSHPRGFGMRIGLARLGAWSFLMSSAHGAGLMLAPVLLGMVVIDTREALPRVSVFAFMAVGIHVLAMLVVMGITAIVVYERIGLRLLRRGWLNLDQAWSASLFGAGAITLIS
jgi:hypothetical protein